MFSYISNKNSISTAQNNLIQQIQSIANDIFDFQKSSITRTDHQQMSLQLSSVTDEDNLNIEEQNFTPQQQIYLSNILKHQIHFQHPQLQTANDFYSKKHHEQKQRSEISNRLTKSMITGHSNIKQPGSFSNNYVPNKNITSSQINFINRLQKNVQQKNLSSSSVMALNPISLNKSNILMGILNENKNKSSSKTPNKKSKFSSYASNYLSPYSAKCMKENPKSYMQKPNLRFKKQKKTLQFQFIKQRFNQNIEPHISYRKQKQQRDKFKDPKFSNVKSKYKQVKPLMHEYKLYADEHIHKKMKNQMSVWEQKKKRYDTLSCQQIESNWQSFIQKEKRFVEERKRKIINCQLQFLSRQTDQCAYSPTKNIIMNGKSCPFSVTPPKMTPQDYIKKYKRQKQKLKQKLQANQISNFIEKSFDDSKKYGKQIFDSIWGSNLSKKSIQNSYMNQFSTIKETSNFESNQISKLLNQNKNQIFFVSSGDKKHNQSFKDKIKQSKSAHHDNNLLTKSSIQSKQQKSKRKSNSIEYKSAKRLSNSVKKQVAVNNLSPFIKKSSYFTGKQLIFNQFNAFDARKHNSPLFNEQIAIGKSKSKNQRKDSNKKISELLNPKYFKSINQLQEYSSTSRQKTDNKKKTFDFNKHNIKFEDSSVKSQQKDLSYNQFRKNSPQKNKKHSDSGFDQRLMNKIIQDLDQMRGQIEQNKKKRKYRIENYRNISNIRKQDQLRCSINRFQRKNSQQKLQRNKLQFYEQNQKGNQQRQSIRRENPRFRNENNFQQQVSINNKSRKISEMNNKSRQRMNKAERIFASRSVSPIQLQDSIIGNSNNLSISMIQPINDINGYNEIKNLQLSQFSSRMDNSSVIMVKSRQQMDFIFEK